MLIVLTYLATPLVASDAELLEKWRALPLTPPPATGDWLLATPEGGARTRRSGVFRGSHEGELILDNGLLRRSFLLTPNLACVEFRQLVSGESLLRAVRPEARITIGGRSYDVGGLSGQPVGNYLLPEWYEQLEANPAAWRLSDFEVRPLRERLAWKPRREWMASERPWPPPGIEVSFSFDPPAETAGAPGAEDDGAGEGDERAPSALGGLRLTVHYALYDGLPLLAKWLTLENRREQPVRLETFTSEILACVEASSEVEDIAYPVYPNLHVETDFTTVAMHGRSAQRETVHWLPDPTYHTQVNYRLETLCLLECRPPLGPDELLEPGKTFETFRTWILAFDDRDAVRQTLALGRMYRTIAPWVLENPLIHHVRSSEPQAVRRAIDQAADVGFELIIMTFGSGFQIENDSADYLASIRELADYAHTKGVALGGYSLLASRSVGAADDVVNPATGKPGDFARFGNSPCLESAWGRDYFRKLYEFFEKTGCDVLEHDGSYPGDACASTTHPGHRGYEDSRWKQWRKITVFYRWCRSRGIYLNVPDWYFLNGSSKTGMGYRESNWSLPREQQEIIERQNIHDGTRFKTPTMGWMFVPLTQYHGGGAAATIEPLREHLGHYERRLQNLLGAGVQACYRGPRIYDTDETRTTVKRWVDFYKRHRAILDSDIVALRRPDGRDWDGLLHVNPQLDTPALAMLYNPLPEPLEREILVPLYFAGLSRTARVRIGEGEESVRELDRKERARLRVRLPPRGAIWATFRK